MFIVSSYWRNSMNIGEMRGYTNKADAKAHWDKLVKKDGLTMFCRAYKLFDNKEPQLLRTEKDWETA
jgi:hypothetical protein